MTNEQIINKLNDLYLEQMKTYELITSFKQWIPILTIIGSHKLIKHYSSN